MNQDSLKNILIDQKEVFLSHTGLIDRDIALDKYLNTKQVVVISGVRRCGKSSLLSIIKNRLQLTDDKLCYFNFDDERILPNIQLLNDIYTIHLQMYGTEPVLFFDEIQVIEGWERFVNRMYEQGLKVFVTGSNAKLLSSEISTSLTGRNKVLELYPFSFAEYLRFKSRTYNISQLSVKQRALLVSDFQAYMQYGGFPLVVKENDLELLNAWFQDILYRDIVARFKLTQTDEVKQIALFLLSNIGKLFSYSTLKNISGIKSLSSVKRYLEYYEMSYLFFYLKKYDFSIKKQMMNSRKVYAIDNGVAHRLGFKFSENSGRTLENAVFIELKRRGYEIYYHSDKHECDFLIKENLKIVEAIQVVYELNADNYKREIAGLTEAMSVFDIPKGRIILLNNTLSTINIPANISISYIYNWMLNE